jgi:aminotransferase EvaB
MIKIFDYLSTLAEIEDEVLESIHRTLHSGRLILGPETRRFEQEFADHVGVKHCVGVTSGTMALYVALAALEIGPGDEVITSANTCVPTVSAIELTGAAPVLADVRPDDLMMDMSGLEALVTKNTRCILPVHLWGQSVDLDSLMDFARERDLLVVEDCAQAQGTLYRGQHVGTFGAVGCFSFYPTKNLGAYGDGGAVITDDDDLAERMRLLRMYGYAKSNYSVIRGINARISEIQATILRVKLRHLESWLARRREIARRYLDQINHERIELPRMYADREHAFHQFVIRCADRAGVIATLEEHGVEYGIHYPTPIHAMPAYQHLHTQPLPVTEQAAEQILSIPVHEALEDSEVDTVISILNAEVPVYD